MSVGVTMIITIILQRKSMKESPEAFTKNLMGGAEVHTCGRYRRECSTRQNTIIHTSRRGCSTHQTIPNERYPEMV